jgi:hypothetical protein
MRLFYGVPRQVMEDRQDFKEIDKKYRGGSCADAWMPALQADAQMREQVRMPPCGGPAPRVFLLFLTFFTQQTPKSSRTRAPPRYEMC